MTRMDRRWASFALVLLGSVLGCATPEKSQTLGVTASAPSTPAPTAMTPTAAPVMSPATGSAMMPVPAVQPAPTTPAPVTPAPTTPGSTPVAGNAAPAPVATAGAGEPAMGAGGAGGSGSDPGFPDKDFSNPVTPCEKGKIQGSEVIIMGESFYALSGEIQRDLEGNAMMAGSPSPYRGYAVSGTTLGNNQIPSQFDRAIAAGKVKLVIMDGGGNDQYSRYCTECPGIVEKLFAKMAENGVEDVLYTFYPDPGNPIGSAPFKMYHDMLRLTIREVCTKTTVLRCHFLDLRPFWKPGDTNDGLHPTASGARHVADAIWDFMKKDCIGQ